jgi:putative ABC transport system permease protein
MRIPILAGRDLADSDRAATPRVAVINQAMARRPFPDEDPIGRHVTVTSRPAPVDFEVVGVVGDARIDGVAMAAPTTIYVPMDQFWETRTDMSLVLRTTLTPDAISRAVGPALAARNPNVPAATFVSMGAVIGDTLRLQRVTTLLLGLLSAAGLLLAALGLYGVLAHHVAERTRELGIRVALGASPRSLVRDVLGRGLAMVLPGLALGFCASRAATGVLARLLRDVPAADPLACALGGLVLAVAAGLASARPAHRAASVDPVRCLRAD